MAASHNTPTITRQGVNGTAVVNVPLWGLTKFAPLASFVDNDDATKAVAKQAAEATMVAAGWGGRVSATRATLSQDGRTYSVSVKHVK